MFKWYFLPILIVIILFLLVDIATGKTKIYLNRGSRRKSDKHGNHDE